MRGYPHRARRDAHFRRAPVVHHDSRPGDLRPVASRRRRAPAPAVHLVSMTADGRAVDIFAPARLEPGSGPLADSLSTASI